jgi:hypothetical protein
MYSMPEKYAGLTAKAAKRSAVQLRGPAMDEQARQDFLLKLEEETLLGGATCSEWCTLIVRECDLAFVAGADLATVITAAAAIETYLRAEYGGTKRLTFAELIQGVPIAPDLAAEIDKLRKYRNGWVHISNPEDDSSFFSDAPAVAEELMLWAIFAQRVLRQTLYENQWI